MGKPKLKQKQQVVVCNLFSSPLLPIALGITDLGRCSQDVECGAFYEWIGQPTDWVLSVIGQLYDHDLDFMLDLNALASANTELTEGLTDIGMDYNPDTEMWEVPEEDEPVYSLSVLIDRKGVLIPEEIEEMDNRCLGLRKLLMRKDTVYVTETSLDEETAKELGLILTEFHGVSCWARPTSRLSLVVG